MGSFRNKSAIRPRSLKRGACPECPGVRRDFDRRTQGEYGNHCYPGEIVVMNGDLYGDY